MNSQVYFENIREKIIETLELCETDLKIAVAWFTDKKIISKVEELSKRGVNISIIIYDDHINQKQLFEKLYYNKAKIYLSKTLMHNKFCIIDYQTVINGSYNWTYSASGNEENIIITNDLKIATSFVRNFEVLSNSRKIDISTYFKSEKEKFKEEFNYFFNENSFPDSYPFLYKKTFSRGEVLNLAHKLYKNNDRVILYVLIRCKSDLEELFTKMVNRKNGRRMISISTSFFLDVFNVDKSKDFIEIKAPLNLVEIEKNGRIYICLINNKGDIVSEEIHVEIKHTDSRNETFFVSKENRLHRIYDVKLNYKEIECDYLYFENDLIFTKSYYETSYKAVGSPGNKKYGKHLLGIYKVDGEKIFEPMFDYEKKEDPYTYILYSYPILRGCRKFVKREHDYSYIKYFRFNSETLELKQFSFPSNTDLHYLTDENGKWIEFYPKFEKLKYNIVNEIKARFKGASSSEIRNEIDNVISNLISEIDEKKSGSKYCYVATMVYQDYNHPKVIILRNFRDKILLKYPLGKWFVTRYYIYSPKFVERFENSFIAKPIALFVKGIVFVIEKTWSKGTEELDQ